MAGGMDLGTSSKGGKKPLDGALNLVPFIDLMAVLIVFLIMSAVWTQLGRLQVAQSGGISEALPVEHVELRVRMTESSLQISAGPTPPPALHLTRDESGRLSTEPLALQVAELKRAFPETAAFTIEAEDGVKYEDLIRVIDTITPSFPSISVTPAS